jgi:hypothetical protein
MVMTTTTRAAVAALGLLTLGAVAQAAAPLNKQGDRRAQCTARGTSARLEVRCPSARLADLLGALQQATGLRSSYPTEFAGVRVSVTTRNATLSSVLNSALSAFNFATWVDASAPAVTQLSIVGMRHSADGNEPYPMSEPAAKAPSAPPDQPRHAGRAARTAPVQAPVAPEASPIQSVVTTAPAPGSSATSTQAPAPLKPTRAPALEVAPPSAYLLSPPSGGRTPVLPQRSSEIPTLVPGMPQESAAN